MKSKIMKILGVVASVAILASMLVAPVSAAVSGVTASIDTTGTNDEISKAGGYSFFFTLGTQLKGATATLTVTFPTAFTVPTNAAPAGIAIAASSGWVDGAYVPAVVAGATYATSAVTNTLTVTLAGAADKIGAGAQVLITVTPAALIVNPATAGDYTVTVKTSGAGDTTAVTSNAFTVVNPTVAPVAGIASVYNSAGVLLFQSTDFATALPAVTAGGTIKLTAGFYNTAFPSSAISCTIIGMGATPGDVVLKSTAAWNLTGATVTIENVTIDNSTGALTMTNATAGTIKNSALKGGVTTISGAGTNTVDACSVTVLTGALGINNTTAATVKNSTFSVAGAGSAGIQANANLSATGNTFNGATGATTAMGINLLGGAASSITGNTFTALPIALSITGGAVGAAFTGNTVDGCGITDATDVNPADAIVVVSTAGFSVTNNVIKNSKDYIITVAANDNLVVAMFNELNGNVKSGKNTGGVGLLNMTHNYWGGAAAPASTATVNYANPIAKKAVDGRFAAATTLDVTTAVGVNIVASTASTLVGATAFAENPIAVALPATVTPVKYWDVFGVATTAATVRFYGTTAAPITASSKIYFYNSTFGEWQVAGNQTSNPFGNYIEVTITAATAPTATQFVGLPFALVTVKPVVPGAVALQAPPYAPLMGAINFPIDGTLSWAPVAGATSYDVVIAEDSTLVDKFAVINYSATTPVNAHVIPTDQVLKYNTIYWWRVRAVNAVGPGAWTVGFFTTAKEPVVEDTTPVTETVPVVITTAPAPEITLQIPASPSPVEPIPSYLLWAVVAVGAVLVIAVIVLIVRTRRIS